MIELIALLRDNPLLLLFVVASLGFLIGQLRLGGFSLGVAAVLFVGLGFGAISKDLKLPEIVQRLGLVLFVYTIGLSSGPGFFRSLGRRGLRDNLLVLGALVFATGLIVALSRLLGLSAPLAAGLFTGALTNTPALAGVVESLKARGANLEGGLETLPVIAYSVAYPMGVIGMMLAVFALERVWRIHMDAESARVPGFTAEGLTNQSVRVTTDAYSNAPIRELAAREGWKLVLGRHRRDERENIVSAETHLMVGDVVSLIGLPNEVARVTKLLGEVVSDGLELNRSNLDFRRVFVSSPSVAGHTLGELQLPQRFGALVTRVRRGDVEFLPTRDTVLELGDRVRIVCPPERMREVSGFLGDSYKALSEVDVLSFGLGIALGLLLGSVKFPLPGGTHIELGIAGGPLIVGLILGWRERTGRVLWQIPFSANLTIRQLGIVLFLAGVGTRSGFSFGQTVFSTQGVLLFLAGAFVTCATATLLLWLAARAFGIPFPLAIGMTAGLQTQPAVLAFAVERAGNELPNQGYAVVYPLAMIAKIMLAQVLLILIR
jgi:putative transport protein